MGLQIAAILSVDRDLGRVGSSSLMCPMFMKEDAQITTNLWEHGPPWPQCNNSNGNTNDPNDPATVFQAAHTHMDSLNPPAPWQGADHHQCHM